MAEFINCLSYTNCVICNNGCIQFSSMSTLRLRGKHMDVRAPKTCVRWLVRPKPLFGQHSSGLFGSHELREFVKIFHTGMFEKLLNALRITCFERCADCLLWQWRRTAKAVAWQVQRHDTEVTEKWLQYHERSLPEQSLHSLAAIHLAWISYKRGSRNLPKP